MKRHDTVPDTAREHDTDPSSAPISETTEPGGPPESAEVDNILDGFSGRPRTYYAKHQAVSNGRNAAKYDAVMSPVKAHTDPGEMSPVILATTAEEPLGRLLQEASRAADARVTVPVAHAPTPPQADARRNETTTPGLRPQRSVPGWLVPALVVSALMVGAVLYFTRSPAGGPAAPIATTSAIGTTTAIGATGTTVQGPASVSGVVVVEPSSSVPAAPISARMPSPQAPAVTPTAATTNTPPPSSSTRPTHSARPPESAPSPSVPPTSSAPRGDMKRNFE